MSNLSCEHEKINVEKRKETYKEINTWFIECSTQSARIRKINEGFCYVCKTRSQRLHACLDCKLIGCFENNHIQAHAIASGHYLGVELLLGHVYCFICKDYNYESIYENEWHTLSQLKDKIANVFWQPTKKEEELFSKCISEKRVVYGNFIGLRGLVNLGQTCYMNCIVQVLTHNPLLRNYFLSAKHTKKSCAGRVPPDKCLPCEMDRLFQEFYSGDCRPHIPHTLYMMWKNLIQLKGYEPQDAHEFFLTMLEILHQHSSGQTSGEGECQCIIHKIYTGFLQSDIQCENCKIERTYTEEFRDICLDLGVTNGSDAISLADCLQRFIHPEQVTSKCESCQHNLATKQLTVQRLPVVISFHLRRLEYGKKITTFVSFPEYLDMSPFISSKRGTPFEANGENHCNSSKTNSLSDNNHYSLFAVVNHSGNKEGGHYISFIRRKQKWYKCDDDLITFVDLQDVLQSEGYILFYHKEVLEYENDSKETV